MSEFVVDILNEIGIFEILGTIITTVLVWVLKFAANWLKENGYIKKLEKYEGVAKMAVKAAEQMYLAEEGPQKFEYAKQEMLKHVKNLGLDLTEEQFEGLIENAVKELRMEAEKIEAAKEPVVEVVEVTEEAPKL